MKQSKETGGTVGSLGLQLGIPAPRIEGIPEAIRPFVEIGMKMQSDVIELCGHRARAWLDWPDTCSSCKTVEDLTSAQSDYLTCMQRDYAHFMDGVLRDTMIEQDEYEEDAEGEESILKTGTPHREAA
jgi:hypothetical protein